MRTKRFPYIDHLQSSERADANRLRAISQNRGGRLHMKRCIRRKSCVVRYRPQKNSRKRFALLPNRPFEEKTGARQWLIRHTHTNIHTDAASSRRASSPAARPGLTHSPHTNQKNVSSSSSSHFCSARQFLNYVSIYIYIYIQHVHILTINAST